MFKYFVFILTILALCGMSFGGNTPPGGWGTSCRDTVYYSVDYPAVTACYNPTVNEFMDCATGAPVVWPGLDIEMWIEAECTFSWERTQADIHRAGSQADANVCITFPGISSCNIPTIVVTHAPVAGNGQLGNLDYLPFISNVPNAADDGYAPANVALTWSYKIDNGAWMPYTGQTGEHRSFQLASCLHNIQIQCCAFIPFHQRAGYYHLGGPGASICPAETL